MKWMVTIKAFGHESTRQYEALTEREALDKAQAAVGFHAKAVRIQSGDNGE